VTAPGRRRPEGAHFRGRRQLARHVEAGTAQEGGIVGQAGRRDVEAAQLGQDVAVDEVVGMDIGGRARHDEHGQRGLGAAANDEGGIARPAGSYLAVRGHGRHRAVQRFAGAQRGHVLDGAVGERHLDPEAVGIAGRGGMLGGADAQAQHPRAVGRISGRPGGDPATQDLVLGAVGGHAPAPPGGQPGRSP
jgi:hypothetical protein